MGILELLYADNFTFTRERSGSRSCFFKIVKRITLHWAPVSILYEVGIPFEGKVIDQSVFIRFSFLIEGFIRFVLFNFMYLISNTWTANFEIVIFIANMTNFSMSWAFASGMWTITKFSLFYKVSCVLVASVMSILIESLFKYLINIGCRLRS